MRLGLKRDEIKLVDYTNKWNEEFLRVKSEILEVVNIGEDRIEHIGSTAIVNMPAKPILDILVGVNDLQKLDKTIFDSLKKIGFLRLKVERPGEIVLAKFTDETYEEKTHYIHLTEFEKDLWKNLIFFKDYLNTNEAARKEYLEIKLDYLKKSSTGIKEYTDSKEAFVKGIIKKRDK